MMGHRNRLLVTLVAIVLTAAFLALWAADVEAAQAVGAGVAGILAVVSVMWDYLEHGGRR